MTEYDNVSKPKHYNDHLSGIECIQLIEGMSFCMGNAVKYLWRAGIKDPMKEAEDRRKACWYLRREANRLRYEAEQRRHTFVGWLKGLFFRSRPYVIDYSILSRVLLVETVWCQHGVCALTPLGKVLRALVDIDTDWYEAALTLDKVAQDVSKVSRG